MPKRADIKKIMLIGSGPIVIGQACEFDYSGVQACKALKEEGFEVVLVNSNPATIMTDPEFADRTYIEPLTPDIVAAIIGRERPDALLPTLGGQTALNLAIDLYRNGVLERHGVELIGANVDVIRKAEDRDLFKQAMTRIGLEMPRSRSVHTLEDARRVRDEIGAYPLIIRPGFTMGGSGGGIAYDDASFDSIVTRGIFLSPTSEVLVEESIIGWKEFEMEVMRDNRDNCVIVCSIENLDPMGIHTGDSITVAPAQTLTDREYQRMRDATIAVMREIGVETGGSNVQFALNPRDGRMVVIEMNPRVSRSSALASKATGFPIAKIAAKLAVGYTLDEIRNDITRETPACFEPSIDYVVTKIPRFAFEKFPAADSTLGTQMKSVGEAMSIGGTFKQSFQKALRSLETGLAGFGADAASRQREHIADAELEERVTRQEVDRIHYVHTALKRGWSAERIHELNGIDPWFLRQLEELAAFEEEIRSAGSLEGLKEDAARFGQAKEFGYSDRQIAFLLEASEDEVRAAREQIGLQPSYGLVDTCAAEFVAHTPYFYSTYGVRNESTRSDRRKIMIIGGGPNRIGQGIEFDYCCVHAAFALRDAGYETIMVNSNPETVSTDYDTSDKLYFEPLTLEDVLHIYQQEGCDGAIVQFGGQTPLNLSAELQRNGVKEAVFPFTRFPGIDVTLTPEMKSTGEVMGIDVNTGLAFLKSQAAAGNGLPASGNVFVSVRDADKAALIPHARRLVELGFDLYATCGTSTALQEAGLDSRAIFRISDGRPNVVDMIERQGVAWIINTPTSGTAPRVDEIKMRAHAVIRAVPITTTIDGLKAALGGLRALGAADEMLVCSLQEYHRHAPVLKGLPKGGTRQSAHGISEEPA